MGICKYGPDVLFVHQGDVFFGLVECCVGECSEDIEAGFSLSVYVVSSFAGWRADNCIPSTLIIQSFSNVE